MDFSTAVWPNQNAIPAVSSVVDWFSSLRGRRIAFKMISCIADGQRYCQFPRYSIIETFLQNPDLP